MTDRMTEEMAREIVEATKRPGSIISVDDPHKAEEYIGIAKGYLQGLEDERKRAEGLVAVLEVIPPERLRALADWIDIRFPEDKMPMVQNDLRRMAKASEQALSQYRSQGGEGKCGMF